MKHGPHKTKSKLLLFLLVFAMIFSVAVSAVAEVAVGEETGGTVYEVFPGDDYRAILATMEPGDELVFHEGTYSAATLRIRQSGTPEQPIVIRGYGLGQERPVLVLSTETNQVEIHGDNVIIKDMEFVNNSTLGNTVRIGDPNGESISNVRIENSIFRNATGITIDTNRPGVTYENIEIVNNAFIGNKGTVLYFGQQNGTAPHTGLVVERNYIDASKINNPSVVGYGMELKPNIVGAIVRHNIVIGSQGPGIMVYGAEGFDPADANIVEQNIVAGARNSSGILVGGGPSVVRHNVTLGNPGGGFYVYDYNNKGYFHQMEITENTSAMEDTHGHVYFIPSSYSPTNMTVTNNRVITKAGVDHIYRNLPSSGTAGWTISGNDNVSGDSALQNLINTFKNTLPVAQSLQTEEIMHQVWPHLTQLETGPLSIDQLKDLLTGLNAQLLTIPANTGALSGAIVTAQNTLDNAEVSASPGAHPQSAADDLSAAIAAAEAVRAQADVEQSAVDEAIADLEAAVDVFLNTVNLLPDKSVLESAIEDAQNVLDSSNISAAPGAHPQSAADALGAAIIAAEVVLEDDTAGQSVVDEAISDLMAAIGLFTNTVNPEEQQPESTLVRKNGQWVIADQAVESVGEGEVLEVVIPASVVAGASFQLSWEQLEQLADQSATLEFSKADQAINTVQLSIPLAQFADLGLDDTDGLIFSFTGQGTKDGSLGYVYDLTIRTVDGVPVTQFAEPIRITFVMNKVALGDVDPNELLIYYYDEETEEWVSIGGTYAAGEVSAETDHFSWFGVFHPSTFEAGDSAGDEDDDGQRLPDTSTPLYSVLLAGLLLLSGGLILYAWHKFYGRKARPTPKM